MSRLKDPRVIIATIVVLVLMVATRIYLPIPLPHIQLPAEGIPGLPIIHIPVLGDLVITNTILAVLTTDILLLGLVFLARRKMGLVPSGMQNVFEMAIEYWERMAVQMLGEDRARNGWAAASGASLLLLFVILSNWAELIPGYDTIGVICEPAHCTPGQEAVHDGPDVAHAERLMPTTASTRCSPSTGLARKGAASESSPPTSARTRKSTRPPRTGMPQRASKTLAVMGSCRSCVWQHPTSTSPWRWRLISLVAIQIVGLGALGLGYVKKFFAFGWIPGSAAARRAAHGWGCWRAACWPCSWGCSS